MEDEDKRAYTVVVNDEDQYSVWLADRDPPAGWRRVGEARPKAECLKHVQELWTDMRPASLRRAMDEKGE